MYVKMNTVTTRFVSRNARPLQSLVQQRCYSAIVLVRQRGTSTKQGVQAIGQEPSNEGSSRSPPILNTAVTDPPQEGDRGCTETATAARAADHSANWPHVVVPWDGIALGVTWCQIWTLTFYLAYGGLTNWAQLRGMPLAQVPPNELASVELLLEIMQLLGVVYLLKGQLQQHDMTVNSVFVYTPSWQAVGQALTAAATAIGVVTLVQHGMGGTAAENAQQFAELIDEGGIPAEVFVATSTLMVGPVLEELVYRGFILTSLTKWLPTPMALAVSSLAFAAFHLSLDDALPLALLGGVLGASMITARGNLLVPTIAHSVYNAAALWLAEQSGM